MKTFKVEIWPIENSFVVTRMVEDGRNEETDEPIFRVSTIARETLQLAVQEARVSLDRFLAEQTKYADYMAKQKK